MDDSKKLPMAVPAGNHDIRPALPALSALLGKADSSAGYVTNIKGEGMERAALITQSLSVPSHDLDSLNGEVFRAQYYLANVVDFISETGEIVPLPRIVLISPDGETLAFTSEGALRSFDLIRQLLGDGPWAPPLPISAVPIKTRRGYRTFRLILGEKNEKV